MLLPMMGNKQTNTMSTTNTRKFVKGDLVCFKDGKLPNPHNTLFDDNPKLKFRFDSDQNNDLSIKIPAILSEGFAFTQYDPDRFELVEAAPVGRRKFLTGDIVRLKVGVTLKNSNNCSSTRDFSYELACGGLFVVTNDEDDDGDVRFYYEAFDGSCYLLHSCLELVSAVEDPEEKRRRDCLAARLLDVNLEVGKFNASSDKPICCNSAAVIASSI